MHHYHILQILTGPHAFMSLEWLKKKGVEVRPDMYVEVFDDIINGCSSNDVLLEQLFIILNREHPAGYLGRSLSVSDIVIIDGHGAYFCDSFGWVLLPAFEMEWSQRSASVQMQQLNTLGSNVGRFMSHRFCMNNCPNRCREIHASDAALGANKSCPLAGYRFRHTITGATAADRQMTMKELNAICLDCKHSSLSMEQGQVIMKLDCPRNVCPVSRRKKELMK